MAAKSNSVRNKVLDKNFGRSDYTPPATWHIALFTVAPTAATTGTEVTAASYSRKPVTNDLVQWPAAASGLKTNAVLVDFGFAAEDWGTIVAAAVVDAAAGAFTDYFFGNLAVARTVLTSDGFFFPAGNIRVTEA